MFKGDPSDGENGGGDRARVLYDGDAMEEQSDEYTLEDEVGQGPLGAIFRGRAPGGAGYERIVAIKHLRAEAGSDDAFVQTLATQAGTLMGRPRPNVEGIVDVVQFGPECYLVVDWIEGPSLKAWANAYHGQSKPAPVGQLLAIAQQILFALHSLHERGLLHGGLNTSAIRLDRLGHPLLTRIGVRTALDASLAENRWATDAGLRLVPPEGGLSVAGDVFGMGLTLYTILAGAGELKDLPDDLRARLLAGKPVDLDPIRQDIPAVVLRTIERALARDPAERFETAASMARSMDFILRSLPEMTDSAALSHSIAEILPETGAKTRTPAKPPRAPGLRTENTDQLDLADLRALRIDQE